MAFWLIKSEPHVFSIEDMENNGTTQWNGVRNYQARNNMKQMKVGDLCFFYHSGIKNPAIVGLVKVVKEHYPDPEDTNFVCVDVDFLKHLPPIYLSDIREMPELHNLKLITQPRLSVMPINETEAQFLIS